jgi:hypothetical protein
MLVPYSRILASVMRRFRLRSRHSIIWEMRLVGMWGERVVRQGVVLDEYGRRREWREGGSRVSCARGDDLISEVSRCWFIRSVLL